MMNIVQVFWCGLLIISSLVVEASSVYRISANKIITSDIDQLLKLSGDVSFDSPDFSLTSSSMSLTLSPDRTVYHFEALDNQLVIPYHIFEGKKNLTKSTLNADEISFDNQTRAMSLVGDISIVAGEQVIKAGKVLVQFPSTAEGKTTLEILSGSQPVEIQWLNSPAKK